jgi:hypothetical protein
MITACTTDGIGGGDWSGDCHLLHVAIAMLAI